MSMNQRLVTLFFCTYLFILSCVAESRESIDLILPTTTHIRVQFGAGRLQKALQTAGYSVRVLRQNSRVSKGKSIVIGQLTDGLLQKALTASAKKTG